MDATVETVETTTSLLNINMSNITKLNSTNYLTLSIQIHALLDGYDLACHIDGSIPPPQTITTNNVAASNPAHTTWKRHKLIIQTVVTKSKTSAEMWKTIAFTYAKPSRGHVLQLKNQLKEYTKGDKTIDEYLQGLTTRFDQLALLDKPIEHEDQIDFLLQGLPEDYKYVVEQVEGCDVSPTITEVHEKLLTKEAKLLSIASSSFPYT